jgi:decaprenylphospho-beta-D-erythro-pentofuranosid-2-ulose 2-reductase
MSSPAGRSVLLVGGNSEIGLAIVRQLAATGPNPVRPVLLGRDGAALTAALADLRAAGCTDGAIEIVDANRPEDHADAVRRAFEHAGSVDLAIVAVGVLGAQAGLDADPQEALEVMQVGFVGTGSLLLESLRRLRAQGHGTLVVLSSVAAERPRAANAIYGAAKAGLDALAQGLADSLSGSAVRVLVVRPGFVRTRMTAGLRAPGFATTPEAVARRTVGALDGRAHTVWAPGALRYVFAVVRLLPRAMFRRIPL